MGHLTKTLYLAMLHDRTWPICDHCKKPVESSEQQKNLFDGGVTFFFFCHGEKETYEIGERELLDSKRLSLYKAFAKGYSKPK